MRGSAGSARLSQPPCLPACLPRVRLEMPSPVCLSATLGVTEPAALLQGCWSTGETRSSPSGHPCSPRRPGPGRTHPGAAGCPAGRAGASFRSRLPALGSAIPAPLDLAPSRARDGLSREQGVHHNGRQACFPQDEPHPCSVPEAQLRSQSPGIFETGWESKTATEEAVGEAGVRLPQLAHQTSPHASPTHPSPAGRCRGEHTACTSHATVPCRTAATS